jgi:hypothetical protein
VRLRVPRGQHPSLAKATEVWGTSALLRFDGFDHHELAHGSLVHELDAAGDLGKEGVIFSAPDVEAGLYPRAALADDNRPAGDHLSTECLESKPLRIRVAAIS